MKDMQRKIDDVFERVRIPESGVSISEANIIEKLRFIESKNKLVVVKYSMHSPEGCCTLISNAMLGSVLKELREELEKEFPGLAVEFV